ncbi:MAG TPA: alpha/beta hydrolase [Chloroflexia bacterium]|nr:alpha/beta hydrolase [Chloroflexia bacterium]
MFSTEPPPADARISYGDDPLQFADLRLPEGAGPHPVVVVLHGGFWRSKYTLEHIGHLCAALTAQGVATWNIEYRRIGDEGGGWPNTMFDAGLGTDYLRKIAEEYNLDLSRVVIAGHSAGGHLAAWVAGRHRLPESDELFTSSPLPLVGCVPLAGVVDLKMCWSMRLSDGIVEGLLGGSPVDVPARYESASPAALLPLGVKQVLVHGTDDTNVPFKISQSYVKRAAALGDDAMLVTLKDTGHFELIDPQSSEWPTVRDAILGLVRGG